MKHALLKLAITLTFAVSAILPSNAQDAFFVYRNDGQFNAFFNDEIDSIVCSNIDLDSIIHEEFVVQEFHTPDSIYRIPIASIDSVGFQKPETIYRPGVTELSGNLRSYILSVDSMTIFFDSSTPTELLPNTGDKLVTTEVSNVFMAGFAGIVSNVTNLTDSIAVTCDSVSLKDIFERYYGVYKYTYGDVHKQKTRGITGLDTTFNVEIPSIYDVPFDLTPWCSPYISLGIGGKEEIVEVAIELDNLCKLSIETPKATFSVIHTTGWGNIPNFLRASAIMNHKITLDIDVSGAISVQKDFGDNLTPLVVVAPLITLLFEPGLFVGGTVEISKSVTDTEYWRTFIEYVYDKPNPIPTLNILPKLKAVPTFIDRKVDYKFFCAKGELKGGVYYKLGLNVIDKDIASLFGRVDFGRYINSDFMLYKSDLKSIGNNNAIYTALTGCSINEGVYFQGALGGSIFKLEGGISGNPYKIEINKLKAPVPHFTDMKVVKNSKDGTATISAQVDNQTLIPMSIGFRLFDNHNNAINTIYNKLQYGGLNNKTVIDSYALKFNGLTKNTVYTAYPIIKLYGLEILASPKIEFKLECEARTGDYSNVKINSAICSGEIDMPDEYNILDYGVCYSSSAQTPTIKNSPFKQAANEKFSLLLEGLKANTVYYYRTYLGIDGEYVYGEVKSFKTKKELGEEVDLGLSVNWRGWNVGATKAEEDGNYFAWGETEQKEEYTWQTYFENPYDENDDWVGCATTTDITGSDKDAATVVLGEKWRTPTSEEMKELMDNCTWKWTTMNEVNGYMVESNVAGYEGNYIFLPAAGNYDKKDVKNKGSYGGYWTSTPLSSESKAAAYNLYFYGETIRSTQNSNRYTGRSIRPVCEKPTNKTE